MKKFYFLISAILLIGLLSGCASQQMVQEPTDNLVVEEPVQNENLDAVEPTAEVIEESPLAQLVGLPIEEFFQEAYMLILQRDPEGVLELGITDQSELPPVLTDFSPEYKAETNQLIVEIAALLHEYDAAALSQSDQISYQVFDRYLQDQMDAFENLKFEYLVNPLSVKSYPQLFIMFFTETHPFETVSDAQNYVARVHLLDEKIDQLIALMETQEDAGIIYPRLIVEYGRADVKNFLGRTPQASSLRTTFRNKAGVISALDEEQMTALEDELIAALKDETFPAFDRLDDFLAGWQAQAPEEISLSYYPGGDVYYQSQLDYYTTTGLTAEEIHASGLAELDRIQAEMREKFALLGYPEDESIPELYQRVIEDSGTLNGEAITQEYERILADADAALSEYFDLRPAGKLEVVGGNVGAFYTSGSFDGSRPGRFYARAVGTESVYQMKTIAYHEGIPGHHYQIALAGQMDLPLFRRVIYSMGYTEGWALYAEYLASELGWYADDPYGDLGRLQYEALRAGRMVVDTGIHAMGWDFEQAVNFLVDNSGVSRGQAQSEVIRYISWPAQATAYLVGKIEILRLRGMAEDALGDAFTLREFHNIVLENGSMPFDVLEEVIVDWYST